MFSTRDQQVDYPQLLHQTYQDALQRNEEAETYWQNVTKDYETLETHLADLPKTLSKEVMVPVAPKAIMPGNIVHTNEILVGLGQGYFVMRSAAQAVEICKRRKKICTDMLEKLEKEKELLLGRSQLPVQQGAFAGANEIIEEYNEETEAHWRSEHKQREKEYRQKLAELREKEQTKIEDEETLWKRLDELELQEELEEELDRLHACDSENEEDEDEEVEENNKSGQEGTPPDFLPTICERDITAKNGLKQRSIEYTAQHTPEEAAAEQTPKRRVSFADLKEDDEEEDVTLRIEFRHSSHVPAKPEHVKDSPIESPGDIYSHFKDQFLSQPKSILKKSSGYPLVSEPVVDSTTVSSIPDFADDENMNYVPLPHPVANEVVERDVTVMEEVSQPPAERPISKFKAARQRRKR